MEGMTVRQKLFFSFGGISVVVAIFCLYLYVMLSYNKTSLDEQSHRTQELILVQKMVEANDKIALASMNIIVDKNKGISKHDLDEVDKEFAFFDKNIKSLIDMCDTQEEKNSATHIKNNIVKLKTLVNDTLISLVNKKAGEEEFDKVDDEIDDIVESVDNNLNTIVSSVSQEMEDASQDAKSSMDRAKFITLLASFGVVGLLILVAVIIISSIQNVLSVAITNILDGSSELLNASSQITNSAINLSDRSSAQSAVVEQVSASVEESYSAIGLTTQNAKEADLLSKEANLSALDGYEHIKKLSKSMEDINVSSNQIANIIKTIDEIAFQTNLLALNAAVEAARAGEHGLGFAVVADEVRSLASRSAGAAKETTQIIEESVQQVKNGNDITVQTNKAFEEILNKSKKTTNIISDIALSSNEQIQSIKQISSSLQVVDNSTQSIASSSEELTATAEELNSQANALVENVFNVSKKIGIHITNNKLKNFMMK